MKYVKSSGGGGEVQGFLGEFFVEAELFQGAFQLDTSETNPVNTTAVFSQRWQLLPGISSLRGNKLVPPQKTTGHFWR